MAVALALNVVHYGYVVPQALARASYGALEDGAFESLANATMVMQHAEAQRWFSLLQNSSSYLEWGTGGSTLLASWLALHTGRPKVVDSIDSSEAWFASLRSRHPLIRDAEAAGKLNFHLGDIGQTIVWGVPKMWRTRNATVRERQSRSYVESIPASGCCYDLFLVDGRFREACALYALRLMHTESMLIVHDSQRYVHPTNKLPIQQYYDAVSHIRTSQSTLHVLRPKPGAIALAKSGDDANYSSLYAQLLDKTLRR